jgi:dienelactone hydrolase
MRPRTWLFRLAVLGTLFPAGAAVAQQRVNFPSLDGQTNLTGYVFRPPDRERHPALVFLHGCIGIANKVAPISGLYTAWASALVDAGYAVLLVDSAGSRGFGQTCTVSPQRRVMFRNRPKDAYGALLYLQQQPYAIPERVGVLGWSQGGATVLLTIGERSLGRPENLPDGDFRVAVALYPGACAERLQTRPFVDAEPRSWTTKTPLLVLLGDADNWTPAPPCQDFIAGAKERGAAISLHIYPGAGHGFDAPNVPRQELPEFKKSDGTIPMVGTDPAARADALMRVPAFLRQYLAD